MTNEQATKALKLLRSVLSDIDGMRDGNVDYFGPFSESFEDDEGFGHVEWPNLAITGHDIAAFLKTVEN